MVYFLMMLPVAAIGGVCVLGGLISTVRHFSRR
jgi:hypothetical protein